MSDQPEEPEELKEPHVATWLPAAYDDIILSASHRVNFLRGTALDSPRDWHEMIELTAAIRRLRAAASWLEAPPDK